MHTHAVLDDSPDHLDELDHLERIGEIRSQLLGHIAEGIAAMQRAAQALEQLRSNSIYDAEFVDGRDGGDVSTFLDDSIRYAPRGLRRRAHRDRQGDSVMASKSQSCNVGSALDTVRDALHSAGQLIRPRGTDALMASCPLHTDHTPSLSVTWRDKTPAGRSGAVLLHCFSCQADASAGQRSHRE